MLLTSGEEARSHRRPPREARARVVSLVAVGALAGGVAIASTAAPWSGEESHLQPEARPGGPSGALGTGPAVRPAPPPAAEGPAGSEAAPAPAPSVPMEPPALAGTSVPAVWRAGGPDAFLRTSWNTRGAMPPRVHGDEVSFQLTGRAQRSELEPALPAVHDGDQHDVTFSVRLDGEFATSPEARQVIARWENDSPGQAPLDLRVNDGELLLHGGEGHPSGTRAFTRTLGRAPLGEWTQLRVLVRFSADPHKAGVSVWRDGRSVVDDDHPRGGTLYPGQQSYLKVGLHRDRDIASSSTVRFSAWRIDHGRADTGADRAGPSRDETPASVRPSTGPSDRENRSTRSGTSGRHASDRSGGDVIHRTPVVQRATAPSDAAGREESGDERSSRAGSNHDVARHTRTIHRGSSSDSGSHREERDTATSEHRPESRRHTSSQATSPRDASQDAGSHQGSSWSGASTDTGARGGDESGERSSDG